MSKMEVNTGFNRQNDCIVCKTNKTQMDNYCIIKVHHVSLNTRYTVVLVDDSYDYLIMCWLSLSTEIPLHIFSMSNQVTLYFECLVTLIHLSYAVQGISGLALNQGPVTLPNS